MPKAQSFDFVVPGSPDEVARTLKEQTRLRPFPTQGTLFTFGGKPFGGRVGARDFTISANQSDIWTLTLPVARGSLEAVPGGTRIQGEVGLHPWMTWYLRAAFLAMVAGGLGTGAWGFATGAQELMIVAAALLVVGVVAGGAGIGLHVAHADDNVEALVRTLRTTLRAPAVPGALPSVDPLADDPHAELDTLAQPIRTSEEP